MGQGDLKEEVGSEMLRTVLCVGAEGGSVELEGHSINCTARSACSSGLEALEIF